MSSLTTKNQAQWCSYLSALRHTLLTVANSDVKCILHSPSWSKSHLLQLRDPAIPEEHSVAFAEYVCSSTYGNADVSMRSPLKDTCSQGPP